MLLNERHKVWPIKNAPNWAISRPLHLYSRFLSVNSLFFIQTKPKCEKINSNQSFSIFNQWTKKSFDESFKSKSWIGMYENFPKIHEKKNNFWCIFVIIHQTNAEKLTITCSSTFSSATSIFEWFDLILYTIWTNFQIKMMFHFSLQQENQPSAMKVLSILNPFVFVHLEWTKICFTIDFPFLYSN